VSWDQFFSYKPEAAYYKQTSTYLLFRVLLNLIVYGNTHINEHQLLPFKVVSILYV